MNNGLNWAEFEAGVMMSIEAIDWRGRRVTAAALLARYRMTIEPAPAGPAWRVVALREVHGRANLHVECRPGEGVSGRQLPLDWSTVAGLVIPATTNEQGIADLPVNAGSYYWPEHGPGPHRVKPAGPADRVIGWGLALGLPDAPPPDLDNRYQTLAVSWAWQGEGDKANGEGDDERLETIREVADALEEQAKRLRTVLA